MFRCEEDTCVPTSLLCDGYDDCAAGDDERPELCRARLGAESPCLAHEQLCGDGRCMPAADACRTDPRACSWRACPQLCVPKHANRTCKCVAGYRQRQLPDGGLACDFIGPRPQLVVAGGGWLRLRTQHEHAPDLLAARLALSNESFAEVGGVASAWVGGAAWAWWGDASGRLRRARLPTPRPPTPRLPAAADPAPAADLAHTTIAWHRGMVRAVAVDAVAKRLYWTLVALPGAGAGGPAGRAPSGVYVGTLAAAKQTVIYTAEHSEPDDLLIHSESGRIFWCEVGSSPGVMSARLSGAGARWVARRRLRRPAALAAAWGRLYFTDRYHDTLESAALDGADRVLIATFHHRPPGAPPPLHVKDAAEVPLVIAGRTCVRMRAWEDSLWCGTARGLVRLPRRPQLARTPAPGSLAPAPAPSPLRPPLAAPVTGAVTALDLLPIDPPAVNASNPCERADGSERCAAAALCVRDGGEAGAEADGGGRGFACLCPDELRPTIDTRDENVKCVPQWNERTTVKTTAETAPGACTLQCGPGKCVVGAAGAVRADGADEADGTAGAMSCACPALWAGPHCSHYRCGGYCLHRGACHLDDAAAKDPITGLQPLLCSCFGGYSGLRCAVPPAAGACRGVRCHNGGRCREPRAGGPPLCLCPAGYTGSRCEQCTDAGACARGEVCARTDDGAPVCQHALCLDYCLNQGVCRMSGSGVSCTCRAAWSGERCQRRACVDQACRNQSHPHGNQSQPHGNQSHPHDNQSHPHDNQSQGHDDSGHDAHEMDNGSKAPADHAPAPHHPSSGSCVEGACAHVGRCVGGVCACAGAWGGPRCRHYVGHDHACLARCPPPALCAWTPAMNPLEPGTPFCTCPEGEVCAPLGPAGAGAGARAGHGGALAGALVALAVLLAAVFAALYLLHRRRHGAFVHARLADNVEINNPMYMADDEPEPPPRHAANGGNHFANPVYESMYAPPENNPAEEQANLLAGSADGSPPPPERAALL